MIDRELLARLDAARVRFCLIGDRALAAHGCAPRNGGVELLTVDEAALRPLFWADAQEPQVTLGQPGEAVLGRVRWPGIPDHELVVGSRDAMVFAVDTARQHDDLGCRVATPLGLVLLALTRGGPGSRADAVELIRAEEAKRDGRWHPKVEEHLRFLPEAGRQSWQLVLRDLDAH